MPHSDEISENIEISENTENSAIGDSEFSATDSGAVDAGSRVGGLMSKLTSMKIRARLNLGFGAMVVLLGTLVGVTLYEVSLISERNTRIVELRVPTASTST